MCIKDGSPYKYCSYMVRENEPFMSLTALPVLVDWRQLP